MTPEERAKYALAGLKFLDGLTNSELWQIEKACASAIREAVEAERETHNIQTDTIARVVQSWLDWQKQSRKEEGLQIDDETHFICNDWPTHMSRGAFKEWVKVLSNDSMVGAEGVEPPT